MPSKEVITFWLDMGAPISLLSRRTTDGCLHRLSHARSSPSGPQTMAMTPEARRAFIETHTTVEPAPFVPEVRLHTGGPAMELWEAAFHADDRLPLPPPYWAWAWAGGQALARYVLDNPGVVRDRSVLDVGSGGGIVAIAAALAGAARVVAADIEPFAIEACRLNAAANGVSLEPLEADLVGTDGGWEVVLAGDVWYDAQLADRMAPWLRTLAARGATVLTGDLGRAYLPEAGLVELARFTVPTLVDLEDVPEKEARVLRLGAVPDRG
jgi:predicted nicotinamide N-methyase